MPAPRSLFLARLTSLYFPYSLFIGAILTQLLAARVEVLAGPQKGVYMAWIGGLGALAATVVCLVVGSISDNTIHPRGRRYPWILWGMGFASVMAIGIGAAPTLPLLLVAYSLWRLGIHAGGAAFDAVIPDRVQLDNQCRASGWGEFWELLAQTTAILICFLLMPGVANQLTGWHLSDSAQVDVGSLLICGLCSVTMLLFIAANLPVLKDAPLPPESAVPLSKSLGRVVNLNLGEVPDFTRLWFSRCVLNMGIYTGIEFLRYYVQDALPAGKGDPTLPVIIIGLTVTAGGVFGAISGGKLGDRVSKRLLLYVYCLISTAAAVCFCLTHNATAAYVIGFFYGIGYSAISTVDWAFATNLLPKGQEGRYLAFFQTAFNGPQILVSVLGGYIGQALGFRAVFWTIPVYLLAGMFILAFVRERHEIPGYSEVSPS